MNEDLDGDLIIFAAKHYYKPSGHVDPEEFYDDMKRFKYVKRLLNRYLETGIVSERLLLNHFIVLFNVFGNYAALKLIVNKLDKKHLPAVKSFMLFLHQLAPNQMVDIKTDENVIEVLRKI
jgi:hypothetical protein